MRKILKRSMLLMLIATLLVGGMATTTFAATKKLKNRSFVTSASKADKKALSVKKGTYTIKMPSKGAGYLKFKAPGTKTYAFKLSNLKAARGGFSCGYFYVMTKYGSGYIGQDYLKTYGGKNSTLWIATKNDKSGPKKSRMLTSRTGKIKLKKGQVVYLYFSFSSNDKLKLKIK